MFLLLLACSGFLLTGYGQECPVNTDPEDRRDCYDWPDLTEQKCNDRKCAYCEHEQPGIIWCFPNDELCPSEIPVEERVDCHPEPDMTRESCNAKDCIYCRDDETPGIPWCFYDNTISQGGKRCPEYELPEAERIDCWPHPISEDDEDNCLTRSCYWCPSEDQSMDAPWCFAPPVHGYYIIDGPTDTAKGFTLDLTRKHFPTWYGADIWFLRVDVEYQEDERVRVKIYSTTRQRFEVPLDIPSPNRKAPNPLYRVEVGDEPAFHFKIIRNATGEILFDTSIGGLVYADQGIQIAARVASDNLYGFGETEHHSFRHDMNHRLWPMWARDHPVWHEANIYGVHPFYTAIDSLSSTPSMHGVLFLNANAQEVKMLPAPGLIYRTTGGILDMYFFLGPEPEQVIAQYTEAIGRPVMPPYWSLGFHLSRYGYNTIENMQAAIGRLREYDIPHDVQHGDIDYFYKRLDFTYDPDRYAGLPQYVKDLKLEGTRFITIQDPCIAICEEEYLPFARGNIYDVWVKEADGVTNAEGEVWPECGPVYFPDYSKPSCKEWWVLENVEFHGEIEFDGLWIDMNEPANFVKGSTSGCNDNMWNRPLYVPRSIFGADPPYARENLQESTLCPDYTQYFGRHYDVHSLYGWSEAEPSLWATRNATGGKRSIVISRSTFVGAGKWTTHWLGDNFSQWSNLHYSIIGMLEFNLFGIPFVGADICGFNDDTNEEMCQRWHQLGAFYTFSRNHNAINAIDQDPGQWPAVAAATREALHIRYTLLPYLYTLFYQANSAGGTVVRGLHHEFLTDSATYDVDTQFLWGPAFLVSAVLTQGATSRLAYFPDAPWYDWYTREVNEWNGFPTWAMDADSINGFKNHIDKYYKGRGELIPTRGASTTLQAPLDFIPLHVRGGYILPTQEPANTTMTSRSKPMGLIAALDDTESATGTLFWDEGDTIDTVEKGEYFLGQYAVESNTLSATIGNDGYPDMGNLIFNQVKVWGIQGDITSVRVDGSDWSEFTFTSSTGVLDVYNLAVAVRSIFEIDWS